MSTMEMTFGLKFTDLHSSPKKATSGKLRFFWGKVYTYIWISETYTEPMLVLFIMSPHYPLTHYGGIGNLVFFHSVLHPRHFRIDFKAESSIISIVSFNFSKICTFHPPPLTVTFDVVPYFILLYSNKADKG